LDGVKTDKVLSVREENLVSPTSEITLIGTKPIKGKDRVVNTEEIAPTIEYREDPDLLKGQTRTVSGQVGQRKTTVVYETDHGVRTDIILSQTSEVITAATPSIVYQGTKVISGFLPEDGKLSPVAENPSAEISTEDIDFTTEFRDSIDLPKGQTKILIPGEKGQRTVITEISREDDGEVRRELSNRITKEPVNQVILVGTKA
ncbi:G5 domain-containing protein, partial [Streptococcus sp. DD10]|uniref:G5 domain-containing protein n=1 Tax=Streptococcus sp. DD10 TaxID=1777878 RepID=UPI0018D3B668